MDSPQEGDASEPSTRESRQRLAWANAWESGTPELDSGPETKRRLIVWWCALASVVVTTSLRLALSGALGTSYPYFPIFLALPLIAAFGGLWPSLAASAAFWLGINLWVVSGGSSVLPRTQADTIGSAFFWLAALGIAALGELGMRRRAMLESTVRLLKAREALLLESEIRHSTLAANLPGGAAFVVGHDLRYILAEGEALATVGMSPELFEGKTVASVVGPALSEEYEANYRRALSGSRFAVEHTSHGRDFMTHGAPLLRQDGEVYAALAVSYDITDRKETERALMEREAELVRLATTLEDRVRERTKELLDANEQLNGFTYSVAHDLRQHIRGISTSASLVIEDVGDRLPGADRESLLSMVQAARRLSAMVDDMLSYARLGRQTPKTSRLILTELAQEVVDRLAQDGECPARLVYVDPGMVALGDATMLAFVFENLVINACKHLGERADPIVHIGKDERGFFVADNGQGFDMRFAHKVFEPFERLEVKSHGTGIGLANVKRIVEKHGGRVWVETAPGKGAKFYFTLPE